MRYLKFSVFPGPSIPASLGVIRPPFLILVPVSVGLGWAVAENSGASIDYLHLLLVLLGALAAHVSVNALNEYEDFHSGLDLVTQRTPFSGGSGILPAYPERARQALLISVISLLFVVAVGAYFLWVSGLGLLPLGVAGILTIVLYTRWLTRSPLLCLIAPGLAFGPLMVMGTCFVLTGRYSMAALWASLPVFFLVSNLLLLNQFPDREADQSVGRNHLLIAWGSRAGIWVYSVFLAAAYLSVVFAVLVQAIPITALLALSTIPLAVITVRGVIRYHNDTAALVPYMARNVLLTLATPALLAVGVAIPVLRSSTF
ncbi:MAG: prenyltransferase [Gammaproteobacteria bacterium]